MFFEDFENELNEELVNSIEITEEESNQSTEVVENIIYEGNQEQIEPEGSNEVTIIGKDTKIVGNITAEGSIEVYGKVEGDIDCLGKLSIHGSVNGNSTAGEVYITAKRLEGNIMSAGGVTIGQGAVVIGDMNALSASIAGAVKGQIDINGEVELDDTAIVKGHIKAKSVQVKNGAVVDGYCSFIYASMNLDTVFVDE